MIILDATNNEWEKIQFDLSSNQIFNGGMRDLMGRTSNEKQKQMRKADNKGCSSNG